MDFETPRGTIGNMHIQDPFLRKIEISNVAMKHYFYQPAYST